MVRDSRERTGGCLYSETPLAKLFFPRIQARPQPCVYHRASLNRNFENCDPDRLDRLARYETHLDRKLERTLAVLLKLKDLRRAKMP